MALTAKFWGTRGSIPSPGPDTVRVGGNTTCVQISNGEDHDIIIDAGTGMRELGLHLIKQTIPRPMVILLTHSHWDHLAGFTFFAPAYHPAFSMSFYGNKIAQEVLQRDIFERRDNRYFPVNMDDFRSEISFNREIPAPQHLGDLAISILNLNHPGNGFAYRFDYKGHSLVFITDNELGMVYKGGNTHPEIVKFCKDVDVLIHDAQYLPSEILSHRGWGHSTYREVIDLGIESGARKLVFTHHDPERNDNRCDSLLSEAREYISQNNLSIHCDLAIEGCEIRTG